MKDAVFVFILLLTHSLFFLSIPVPRKPWSLFGAHSLLSSYSLPLHFSCVLLFFSLTLSLTISDSLWADAVLHYQAVLRYLTPPPLPYANAHRDSFRTCKTDLRHTLQTASAEGDPLSFLHYTGTRVKPRVLPCMLLNNGKTCVSPVSK